MTPAGRIARLARMVAYLRRFAIALSLAWLVLGSAQADEWADIVARARGQTVYFNAWGGSEKINAYVAWAGERVAAEYGVTLRQVKLDDTATAVAR